MCVFAYPRRGVKWFVGAVFIDVMREDHFQRLESSEAANFEFHLVSRLAGHMAPVLGLCFHPSGQTIATSGADDIGILWTFTSPLEPAHNEAKMRLDMLPRGTVSAPATDRQEARAWNSLGFLQGHREYVTACAFRADGVLLATASRDCTVKLWRTPRHFATSRVSHHLFKCIDSLNCRNSVSCLGFGRRACMSILWAGTYLGEVCSWNTHTALQCVPELLLEDHAMAHTLQGTCTSTHPLSAIMSPNRHSQQQLNGSRGARTSRPHSIKTSDWSRMVTPHDLAPQSQGADSEAGLDGCGLPLHPCRFAAVDPWDTRVCKADTLQVGARKRGGGPKSGLRSSMKTGNQQQDEQLLDRALRLMHDTIQMAFQGEPLVAATIEIDQSGLIVMIQACKDALNPKHCIAVTSNIVVALVRIIA